MIFRAFDLVAPTPPRSGVVVVATYLPVARWRHVVPFYRLQGRIRRQLRTTPGLVWFSVQAQFGRRRFWTISVWENEAAMRAFVPTEPHGRAVRSFSVWGTRDAKFVEWTAATPWVRWTEAYARLDQTSPPDRILSAPLRVPPVWTTAGAPARWPQG